MKRTRVKTKTGCSTCRSRRKKCDESKPVCGACVRLKLHCDWIYVPRNAQRKKILLDEHDPFVPADEFTSTLDSYGSSEGSSSPAIPLAAVVHCSPLRMRPSEGHLLHVDKRYHPRHILPKYLESFVTPMARSQYKRPDPWLGIIMSQPWSRDAIMAFGASWLSLSDRSYMLPCSQFYASAIEGLQTHLRKGEVTADNIETGLIASYFLGLFETFWSKHTVEPMYHFSAVARMLALEDSKRKGHKSETMEQICTVVSETMLYNVTTNAMFARDLSIEMQTWESMQKYFKQTDECQEAPWLTQPLLFGRRDMFSLSLKIMYLCRQDLSNSDVQSQIRICADIQKRMFDEAPTFYPSSFPVALMPRYISRHKIIFLTLHLLLLKLKNPQMCSAHPDMQAATEALLHAVRTQYTTRTKLMSDGLTWPFCTLLCSANTLAQFEEAEALAREYIPLMANGVQHRMLEAVRLIGSKRMSIVSDCQLISQGRCDGKHSCLDVLIHPNGVLVGAVQSCQLMDIT